MSLESIAMPASYEAFHERAFRLDKLGIPENDFMDEVVDAASAEFSCGVCHTRFVSVDDVSEAVGAHYDLSDDHCLSLARDLENWAHEFSTDGALCRTHANPVHRSGRPHGGAGYSASQDTSKRCTARS